MGIERSLTEKATLIIKAVDAEVLPHDLTAPERLKRVSSICAPYSRQAATAILRKAKEYMAAFLASRSPSSSSRLPGGGALPSSRSGKENTLSWFLERRKAGVLVTPHDLRVRLETAVRRPVGEFEYGRFLTRHRLNTRTTNRQVCVSPEEGARLFLGFAAAVRLLIPDGTPATQVYTTDESPVAQCGEQKRYGLGVFAIIIDDQTGLTTQVTAWGCSQSTTRRGSPRR